MSSDNILVIGKWPRAGGFEYRVADVGFSQYSSTYGVPDVQLTNRDAVCILKDFGRCRVFDDEVKARREARRIRKEYVELQQALEYGTTEHQFDLTWAQLKAMAET